MTIWFFMLVTGYIFSWFKEGLGGVIMILAGLTVSIPFFIFTINFSSLIFAIPSIIAGLLFLIYWWDVRRKRLSSQIH